VIRWGEKWSGERVNRRASRPDQRAARSSHFSPLDCGAARFLIVTLTAFARFNPRDFRRLNSDLPRFSRITAPRKSLLINMMRSFSKARRKASIVYGEALISPGSDSTRLTTGSEMPDFFAKSTCLHRNSMRAARICSLVSVNFSNFDSSDTVGGLDGVGKPE
jgi:hypothetical protein